MDPCPIAAVSHNLKFQHSLNIEDDTQDIINGGISNGARLNVAFNKGNPLYLRLSFFLPSIQCITYFDMVIIHNMIVSRTIRYVYLVVNNVFFARHIYDFGHVITAKM